MNVLIVCSGNVNQPGIPFNFEIHRSFIYEQVIALNKIGVKTDLFFIRGKGITGYLKNLPLLKKKIARGGYHLVHAHNGLSGLLACLQRRLPVVCTFHGSDLYERKKRLFSSQAVRLSKYAIYVSEGIRKIGIRVKKNDHSVIPCGIDLSLFQPVEKGDARKKLGLDPLKPYALFSSQFHREIKNYPLARQAADKVPGLEVLELKGYTRREVAYLMNACDMLLLSSFRETGPQVVKEAMACNCPVVSTDVGTVRELIDGIEGCYISSFDPGEYANCINRVLGFGKRTDGRNRVLSFGNQGVAVEIKKIYEKIEQTK